MTRQPHRSRATEAATPRAGAAPPPARRGAQTALARAAPSDETRGSTHRGAAVQTIGVAGGGQLARMMAPAARRLGLTLTVLDPDPRCSAASVADELVVGDFADPAALARLAERADVITFEIERTDVEGLRVLENRGCPVAPAARVLEIIQDKLEQKRFLAALGVPVPAFRPFESDQAGFDPPFVWKARRGGYDGRGVAVVTSAEALESLPRVPAMAEVRVDIERELAIMVARSADGEVVLYPVTEILMDPEQHVMDTVIAPASVAPPIERDCREIARRVVEALDYVGVLAIEFFIDRKGEVLVNELSPRPHNSGHYTIEACVTSQFEQHLRAIAGLGLGASDMHCVAATFNLLGSADATNPADRLAGCTGETGVFVHDYGKAEIRPGRKLGHVTVTGEDHARVLARVRDLKATLGA